MATRQKILHNLHCCGWQSAAFADATERQMRELVDDKLVIASPPWRCRRTTDMEYGITQAGRDAINNKERQ